MTWGMLINDYRRQVLEWFGVVGSVCSERSNDSILKFESGFTFISWLASYDVGAKNTAASHQTADADWLTSQL